VALGRGRGRGGETCGGYLTIEGVRRTVRMRHWLKSCLAGTQQQRRSYQTRQRRQSYHPPGRRRPWGKSTSWEGLQPRRISGKNPREWWARGDLNPHILSDTDT
jgi:hypothetical protein